MHENLPLFLSNLKIYEKVKELDPSLFDAFNGNEFEAIIERTKKELGGIEVKCIHDMFTQLIFNRLLTQPGLDFLIRCWVAFLTIKKKRIRKG